MPIRIYSLQTLARYAEQHKAVIAASAIIDNGIWLWPADVVLNLQGTMISKFIKEGLYLYEAEKKNKKEWINGKR
jgi:hypothetical protein